MFRKLEYLNSPNIVLRNIELSDGALRSELDAIVITPKCLTIVEVKNTGKDIFIDENGNYFPIRTCFLCQLNNIIESYTLDDRYSEQSMQDLLAVN